MARVLRFVRNLFGDSVTGDVGNVAQPNYQLYGRVEVSQDGVSYVDAMTYLMDPSESVSAYFVVNDGFRGLFTKPDFNPWTVTAISKVTYGRLFGNFHGAEHWGTPPTVQGTEDLIGEYLVLNGGVRHGLGLSAALTKITTDKKFLTWHPDNKVVSPTSPELLHFLVMSAGITTVNLRAQIFYTDLTNTTVTAKTLGSIAQWDLLRIPAGVTNLDLAAVTPAKSISHYSLWLTDQTNAIISEVKTYEIDQYTYLTERFWMYQNSFGMPEIFRTTGRANVKNTLQYSQTSRMITYEQDPKQASFRINSTVNRSEREISTGFLRDRETAYYMLDFLSQRGSLYELRDSDFFPTQMLGPSVHDVEQDDDFNYFLRFKVLGAFDDTVYSE